MLNHSQTSWKLDPVWCPCDVHFLRFLEAENVQGASIFHFGTGEHHHVGIGCAEKGKNNSVLGITASKEEYAAYIDLVIARPEVARFYTAYFGDIYLLNEALLPTFDIVTLFHLCEFRTAQNEQYGALTDLEVAQLLLRRLRPGGFVLFYMRSGAFALAHPVIMELQRLGLIEPAGSHETLLLYRKP
jgi:hypothetical protein